VGRQARLRKQRRAQQVEGILLQDRVLELYAEVAPVYIYKYLSHDCCLNATRVAIDVLHAFGVEARPLTTKVLAFNPPMWERVQAKSSLPDQTEMDEWVAAGAWCLGVDGVQHDDKTGWPWHLIAITKDRMLDSSSLQMSRIHRNLKVDPVIVAPIPRTFACGGNVLLRNDFGTVLSYTSAPEVDEFKSLPGFQRSPHNLDVARHITFAIDARLKAEAKPV
jgi:hypothetical protein